MIIQWEMRKKVIQPFCSAAVGDNYGDGEDAMAWADLLIKDLFMRFEVYRHEYEDPETWRTVMAYFVEKVTPHKLAVYRAGMELAREGWFFQWLGVKPDEWEMQLMMHDLSKFSANETLAYATHDFKSTAEDPAFTLAWHHHKMNNPHHPEYWLSAQRGGEVKPMQMPRRYVAEMVADWMGAGATYGTPLKDWLPENLHQFVFDAETKYEVMSILDAVFHIKTAIVYTYRIKAL